MRRDRPVSRQGAPGGGATALGFACALGWAGLVAAAYCARRDAQIATFIMFAAAALGPIATILFSAWAVREAARAAARAGAASPRPAAIEDARTQAAALRAEMAALDGVVHIAARRLDAFETGLRKDGGALARLLADDVALLARVRRELNAETAAIGEAVAAHAAALRAAVGQAAEETRAAAALLDSHIHLFGENFARIGKRSAEFAAAAAKSPPAAEIIAMRRPAPVSAPTRDLARIIADSGVRAAEALTEAALDRIAHEAARGPAARREAVRAAAPAALRKISAALRRDAAARRDAENLRREPGRALGAANESEARRRELASAYLLIDAALG